MTERKGRFLRTFPCAVCAFLVGWLATTVVHAFVFEHLMFFGPDRITYGCGGESSIVARRYWGSDCATYTVTTTSFVSDSDARADYERRVTANREWRVEEPASKARLSGDTEVVVTTETGIALVSYRPQTVTVLRGPDATRVRKFYSALRTGSARGGL